MALLEILERSVRGFIYQTILSCAVFVASYFVSNFDRNINWVYGPMKRQEMLPQPFYMVLMMVFVPTLVYYPTYRFLRNKFGNG